MMRYRALIAGLLIAAITLPVTGCGLGKSKVSPASLTDYANKTGAIVYKDVDEWLDDTEDMYIFDPEFAELCEDGIAVSAEGHDLKEATLILGSGGDMSFYDRSMSEGTIYIRSEADKDKEYAFLIVTSYRFDDEDDAREFYESWDDNMRGVKELDGVAYDSTEEGNLEYSLFLRYDFMYYSLGIYREGRYVTIVMGQGADDETADEMVNEVCGELDVASPSETLGEVEQVLPVEIVETTEADPVIESVIEITEETTEETIAFEEIYSDAISAYITVMQEKETVIRDYESSFLYSAVETCGLCDLNGDGIPELYYISEDPDVDEAWYGAPTGSLHVYSYDPETGEAVNVITKNAVFYAAGDGGSALLYCTPDAIVLGDSYGEELYSSNDAEVYDLNWNYVCSFTRAFEYDYDAGSSAYYYIDGSSVSQEEYEAFAQPYIDSAYLIVLDAYYVNEDEIDYSLLSLPKNDTYGTYDYMLGILESMG